MYTVQVSQQRCRLKPFTCQQQQVSQQRQQQQNTNLQLVPLFLLSRWRFYCKCIKCFFVCLFLIESSFKKNYEDRKSGPIKGDIFTLWENNYLFSKDFFLLISSPQLNWGYKFTGIVSMASTDSEKKYANKVYAI